MSSVPCKVFLIAPLPPPNGGIGHWTKQLLSALHGETRVRIFHLDTSPRWRSVHDLGLGIRLLGGSLQGIRDALLASWLLLRHRPAVIHLCTTCSLALLRDILILGLARRAGARVVYQVRIGRLATAFGNKVLEGWGFKFTSRLADVVLVLDSATESAVRANCRVRSLQRIPNFIDIPQITASACARPPGHDTTRADETLRILYVGWSVPTKGLRELVGAFAKLPPGSASLTLVGPVEEKFRRELESLARSEGCADAVSITGELSHGEVLCVMAGCDILVLPSYSEGFPNVLLEAMALGRPIVATAVGAIAEMLGDGELDPCGIVIPPKDVASLASAIARLLEDPSLRHALGAAGMVRVKKRYSREVVVPQYVELWCRLASRG